MCVCVHACAPFGKQSGGRFRSCSFLALRHSICYWCVCLCLAILLFHSLCILVFPVSGLRGTRCTYQKKKNVCVFIILHFCVIMREIRFSLLVRKLMKRIKKHMDCVLKVKYLFSCWLSRGDHVHQWPESFLKKIHLFLSFKFQKLSRDPRLFFFLKP